MTSSENSRENQFEHDNYSEADRQNLLERYQETSKREFIDLDLKNVHNFFSCSNKFNIEYFNGPFGHLSYADNLVQLFVFSYIRTFREVQY